MKQLRQISTFLLAGIIFFSCQKEHQTVNNQPEEKRFHGGFQNESQKAGHVYTMSNESSGNRVLDFERSSNGILQLAESYETGGNGTGGGLGNQGGLILSDNGRFLLGINAGSNSIFSFKIQNNKLKLVSTVSSNGIQPISITQAGDLVYVLNGGGSGNITGFKLRPNGDLEPIPGSSRPLSRSTAGPAQISFVHEGRVLVITEKATNKIITYALNFLGIPGAYHEITAANNTPFGFATGWGGDLFVSEAAGGASGASSISSYHVRFDGEISLVVGPVFTGQSAACWVARTGNGKFAYITNTASNTVSSVYALTSFGLTLKQAAEATTENTPIDAAVDQNSRYLYVLNSGSHSLSAYEIDYQGNLNSIQNVPGLPTTTNGLAAD